MLKDIAKVLVGILVTKIGFGIWLIWANMLPITILGLDWGFASIIIFVLAGFVILILYFLIFPSVFLLLDKFN